MNDWLKIILTSSFTIIGAVIIFLFKEVILFSWLKPYYKFKKELIKTNLLLRECSSILTNNFNRENIEKDKNLQENLNEMRKRLKNNYDNLVVSYRSIRKRRSINFIIRILLGKIPNEKEMDIVFKNYIFLMNSFLGYVKEMDEYDNPIIRDEKIKEIIKIIEKY